MIKCQSCVYFLCFGGSCTKFWIEMQHNTHLYSCIKLPEQLSLRKNAKFRNLKASVNVITAAIKRSSTRLMKSWIDIKVIYLIYCCNSLTCLTSSPWAGPCSGPRSGDHLVGFLSDVEKQLAAMRKKVAAALPGSDWTPLEINPNLPPERADIVIVGGGVVGWSVAYWLKKKERVKGALKVVVVEKDLTVRIQNHHHQFIMSEAGGRPSSPPTPSLSSSQLSSSLFLLLLCSSTPPLLSPPSVPTSPPCSSLSPSLFLCSSSLLPLLLSPPSPLLLCSSVLPGLHRLVGGGDPAAVLPPRERPLVLGLRRLHEEHQRRFLCLCSSHLFIFILFLFKNKVQFIIIIDECAPDGLTLLLYFKTSTLFSLCINELN